MAGRRPVTVLGLVLAFLLGACAAYFMWGAEGIAQADDGDDIAENPPGGPFPGKCDVDIAMTKEGLEVTFTAHTEFRGAWVYTCTGSAGQARMFCEDIEFSEGVELTSTRSLRLDDLQQAARGYVRLEFYEEDVNRGALVFRGAYLIHTEACESSDEHEPGKTLSVSYVPAPDGA